MYRLSYIFFIAIFSILFISCDEEPEDDVVPDENDGLATVENYLSSEDKYSQFLDLLNSDAEVSAIIEDETKDITVFALSNETINTALGELGIDSLDLLYTETLQQIVRYHLNATVSLQREDFKPNRLISTMQSEKISFNENIQISSGGLNSAIQFIAEEIIVENGVIHEIESLMIPPSVFGKMQPSLNTINFPVQFFKRYSQFKGLLENSGAVAITNLLNNPEVNLTLFLPINNSFDASQFENYDNAELTYFIENHILENKVSQNQLEGTFSCLSGIELVIDSEGNIESREDNESTEAIISKYNAYTYYNNGVIHEIEGVLTSPDIRFSDETILNTIANSPEYSEFNNLITAFPSLIDIIQNEQDITVFIPTNQAFEILRNNLDIKSLESLNPDILEAVLAFHIHTAGLVERQEMTESTSLPTVQGENITFNANGNIQTGGSNTDVQFFDLATQATNGIIHPVESVLIPPVQVFQFVAEHLGKVSQAIFLGADFSILANAINKADEFAAGAGQTTLKSVLADENMTLTVFGPVNQVFEEAGVTLDSFSGQEWYGLIANHILLETVFAADLNGTYISAAGSPITVVPSGGLDSNGQAGAEAIIAVPDAFISEVNGVVHAIAGILVLPTESTGLAGSYMSETVACAGDSNGNCDPDLSGLEFQANVTLTDLGNGYYEVDDLSFGLYPQGYGIDEVPGELFVDIDGNISITDQFDQFDDPFNGQGQVNNDGTISIFVSNSDWGDEIETTLTPAGSRVSFKNRKRPNYNLLKK